MSCLSLIFSLIFLSKSQAHLGCSMYGFCGQNGHSNMNCVYDGPPKQATQSGAISTVKNLCSHLFEDGNTGLCCDEEQIETLARKTNLPRQLLGRCPACFANFMKLWCDFTCSNRQAEFVKVIAVGNESRFLIKNSSSYTTKVLYFVNSAFVLGLFNSCRNVRAMGGEFALSLMCGGKSAQECNVISWLSFMGTTNEQLGIPFDIHFRMVQNSTVVGDDGRAFRPPSTPTFSCSDSVSNLPCSCQDCPASCQDEQIFPQLHDGKCQFTNIDCMITLSMLLFVALFFIAIIRSLLRPSKDNDVKNDDYNDVMPNTDISTVEKLGAWFDHQLESISNQYGHQCFRHPMAFLLFGSFIALICSSGLFLVRFTTDPVQLWSSSNSRARQEKHFFDTNFAPFYRVQQVIIYPKNQAFFPHTNRSNLLTFNPSFYGPVFNKKFLLQVLSLQNTIVELKGEVEGIPVNLTDICLKPMAPENANCTIMSLLNYFQNDESKLNKIREDLDIFDTFDYFDHIEECIKNPYNVQTNLNLSCLASFGGPIQPYVVLGDFNKSSNNHYDSARGVVLTILLDNQLESKLNRKAQSWEAEFINFMQLFNDSELSISFLSERSIQDELERESKSDLVTILISYLLMFAYIAFSLGRYNLSTNSFLSLFIHSQMMLGLVGVLIVAFSVTSSIGFYSFLGVPATMIILEVQPFLVLAVGVDNIFIFVQAYQRAKKNKGEDLEMRIGKLSGEVIPSMLLSSLSECCCFFIGALSSMPAVRVFSLYAALAIFFDFFLQMTCFLPLFTMDISRQEADRMELCCCLKSDSECSQDAGYLFVLFKNVYAPFLLSKFTRIIVLLTFLVWFCTSIAVMDKIKLGLDQRMAVPEDSYVLAHFNNMDRFLSVGPPVYFVINGPYDFGEKNLQNAICEQSGCDEKSLGGQVANAAKWMNRSYIAHPVMNWLDDYLNWLEPQGQPPCCRRFINGSFCAANVNLEQCQSCNVEYKERRPRPDLFHEHIRDFLADNPSKYCAKGGHAAFNSALKLNEKGSRVESSYFMTYHSVLKTSSDFINAMISARRISDNISIHINSKLNEHFVIHVFPYSVFYVFYEQYLSIVFDAILQLALSIGCIFLVSTILLGLDPWSALIIILTIGIILSNLVGLMFWWSIDFNAISLVNLVMAVGISVEFCSHTVRAFAISVLPAKVDRTKEALTTMGCSVLSGITLTKFGGILVLAFAHSQIFKVIYFRMYLGIVLIGAAHGLVLLPVILSFIGPPVNRRRLMKKTRVKKHGTGELVTRMLT